MAAESPESTVPLPKITPSDHEASSHIQSPVINHIQDKKRAIEPSHAEPSILTSLFSHELEHPTSPSSRSRLAVKFDYSSFEETSSKSRLFSALDHPGVFETLFRTHSDLINAVDEHSGDSLLIRAVKLGNYDAVKTLCAHKDIDLYYEHPTTGQQAAGLAIDRVIPPDGSAPGAYCMDISIAINQAMKSKQLPQTSPALEFVENTAPLIRVPPPRRARPPKILKPPAKKIHKPYNPKKFQPWQTAPGFKPSNPKIQEWQKATGFQLPYIDFLDQSLFNPAVRKILADVMEVLARPDDFDGVMTVLAESDAVLTPLEQCEYFDKEKEEVYKKLDTLRKSFITYLSDDEYINFEELGNILFSQFLQHLVFRFSENPKALNPVLLEAGIDKFDDFFLLKFSNEICTREEDQLSILNAICKIRVEKDGLPLKKMSLENRIVQRMVKKLMLLTVDAFEESDFPQLETLLTLGDIEKNSPLLNACRLGTCDAMEILLQTGQKLLGGEENIQFLHFLAQCNIHGDRPITSLSRPGIRTFVDAPATKLCIYMNFLGETTPKYPDSSPFFKENSRRQSMYTSNSNSISDSSAPSLRSDNRSWRSRS